ncbi:MAG: hypothetical protein GXP54_04370, partial [Deltaproteobacteria bacterium]|nr:hypothetical protein [Deltaproteobacteria bacterium]
MMRALLPLVAVLLIAPTAVTALAQPSTTHFRFVPDEGSVGVAERLARVAEEKRRYVLRLLGAADDSVIEVRIASNENDMMKMVGSSRPVRDWIAGLAMADRDLIVLSARGNEVFNAVDTFVHELAHVYLRSALDGRGVPRWFNEGFAMLVASEQVG